MPLSSSSFANGNEPPTNALPVPASLPCSARPTPARRIWRSNACWRIRRASSACRCGCLAREVYNKVAARAGRGSGRADHRRGEDQAAEAALSGSRPSRRCRATSTYRFWPSMKSRSRPIWNAATSSPTASCNRRGRDETLSARCGDDAADHRAAFARCEHRHPAALCHSSNSRGIARSRGKPRRTAIVAFSADEVYAIAELIKPPAWRCGRGAGLAEPAYTKCSGRDVPELATSIIWWRRTPSAWASISMSITSHSRPTANMTAINFAGSIRPSSRRSQAAPGARPATAPSAPPAVARHSSPNWSTRCRTTPSIALRCCSGAIQNWISRRSPRCKCRSRLHLPMMR